MSQNPGVVVDVRGKPVTVTEEDVQALAVLWEEATAALMLQALELPSSFVDERTKGLIRRAVAARSVVINRHKERLQAEQAGHTHADQTAAPPPPDAEPPPEVNPYQPRQR